MLIKTGSGLVDYAKHHLGACYWWGTYGQIASKELLSFKKTQYPSVYNADYYKDAVTQFGKRVFDCCGLIKGYLWSETPDSLPKYVTNQDVNVTGLFLRCTVTGNLSTLPEKKGILLFTAELDHVGVYIGEGMAIEARGHSWGVVKTKVSERNWRLWGMLSFIDYDNSSVGFFNEPYNSLDKSSKSMIDKLPQIKKGDSGVFVKLLQILLSYRGYKIDTTGNFSEFTSTVVRNWQSDKNLEVDGICGKNTWTSLIL